MIQNLVSIITPLYNAEKYITETINSVINQTYKNWEMIIIDDCSSDNGAQIVKEYEKKDKRIKYIKLEENSGAAIARNIGIEKAKGEFIGFLDSDDLWKKDKLEKQINFMRQNEIAFSFTQYEKIDEESNKLNILVDVPSVPIGYRRCLLTTPIGCLTAVYSVKKLGKVYMPQIRKRQDIGLWLKILKNGIKAVPLKENLAEYRLVKGSTSFNKKSLLRYQWFLYRKIEKISVIESLFFLVTIILTKIFKIKEKKIVNNNKKENYGD